EAKFVFGNGREKVAVSVRQGQVLQSDKTARGLDPAGDEKTTLPRTQLLQRLRQTGVAVLVVTRGDDASGRVGADHENGLREQGRFLNERGGPGQPQRGAPGELMESLTNLGGRQGWFINVGNTQLEDHGEAR